MASVPRFLDMETPVHVYYGSDTVRDGVKATHAALDRGIKVRILVPQPSSAFSDGPFV